VKVHHAIVIFLFAITARAAEPTVVIEAGDFHRRETPVAITLPNASSFAVQWKDGRIVPLQEDGERGLFILPELKRGEKITAKIVPMRADVAANVIAKAGDGAVKLSAFGKPVFTYHTQKTEFPQNRPDLTPIFHRAAYIHPVTAPTSRRSFIARLTFIPC
jgi:hypothetical protein